jgi:monoamine oxidase
MQRRQLLKGIAATSGMLSMSLWARSSSQYDVVVIGAGLSGLTSACHLQKFGYNVLILEARNRVGGRIHTIESLPTKPDLGGLQIGLGYGAMRTYAMELGLPLVSLGSYAKQTDFLIDGSIIKAEQWPDHKVNKLNKKERKTKPSSLYFKELSKGPQFSLPRDWTLPQYQYLDISMFDYLKEQGASSQALALIDANLNAISLKDLSANDAFYRLSLAKMGTRQSHRIAGGNSQFTKALAAKMANKVHLGKAVLKINNMPDKVEVCCQDGSQYRAQHCIVTLPFSALRDVEISGELSQGKANAIQQAKYTPVTQVHFSLKSGVNKQEIPAVNLWSNHAFGRIFTQLDSQGNVQHMNSWINGQQAVALDRLSSVEAINTVQTSIEKNYPPLKGKIAPVYHCSWANETYSKGAYIQFSPGQIRQMLPYMAKPEGRLLFAGEHTEFDYSGMESAIVSGLRAAQEVQGIRFG